LWKCVPLHPMEKVCNICKVLKPFKKFYVRKDSKDGLRNDCIICHRENKRIYGIKNCDHRREYMRQFRINNPDYQNSWIQNNREQYLWNSKKWKIENPEKDKIHKRNTRKKRLENDPTFRLKENIRRLILLSFSKKGYSKSSKTNEILGINYEGFIKHIESQFTDGMTWENKGRWELDHKVPVSLGKTMEEITKLNHYSNFQPLWREDNMKKSNKLIYENPYF